MTGSGKTTFISKVTGRTDLQIGHDLTSCMPFACQFKGAQQAQAAILTDFPRHSRHPSHRDEA